MRTLPRGQSTFIFNHILDIVTYSPGMSYLAPSTSSLQSTETIGQGAVGSEPQERYAYQPVNSYG